MQVEEEKLAWPPLRSDLVRLYVGERLSADKIAQVYGLRYASPKTAESTILYHLKQNGIERRDKAEHIKKVTKEMVDGWVARYTRGESLKQIAGQSVDQVTVWNYLKRRGVQLRDKVEAQIKAVTKHERKPFLGDGFDEAYLQGIALGDLYASTHGRAIRVRLSTTHPAMLELFSSLFGDYGPIYKYPKRSALTGFEWSLDCDLDSSFQFLTGGQDTLAELFSSEEVMPSFLAGFFDADGSLFYHKKGAHGGFEFSLTNLDESLLKRIAAWLASRGFTPRVRQAAQTPDRGVEKGGNWIWKLSLWRYAEVERILRLLPLRHREKIAKREIALRLGQRPGPEKLASVMGEWIGLKNEIRGERDRCVEKAARAFHDRPTVLSVKKRDFQG